MVLRAALIGCGKIGSEFADDPRVAGIYSHAGAYAACAETMLIAVCDTDPDVLERCGNRWNVAARYRDAWEMLAREQPDIVSICTPDQTHYGLVLAALAAPGVRGVLAEKPLALELDQARELVWLARERGIVLAVNYSRRYAVSHVRLKQFLAAGGIGAIQTVGGYYTRGTLHNGTHWFDLARFLVGEVVAVRGADVRKEVGGDPSLDAVLEFENGTNANVHALDAAAFSLFEVDLIGTSGRVRVVESGHVFETYRVVESPFYTGYRTLGRWDELAGGLHDVLLHAVRDIVRCLREGGQPRCSGEDGVAALEIALAVRESARSGCLVPVGRR